MRIEKYLKMRQLCSGFSNLSRFQSSVFLMTLFFASENGLYALPEIQKCETEYYDISGQNGNELLAQMREKNEIKNGYFGVTRYSYKNKCTELSLQCKVRLPRWIEFDSSPNDVLKQKWEKFYLALVKLHQGHVDIFNAYMNFQASETENLDCRVRRVILNHGLQKCNLSKKNIRKKLILDLR